MDKIINDPLVSVILPVYNAEKFVVAAIESILNQDYRNFELLVINDGSTDASETLIKKINDPRIVFVTNETNLGLIASLNKGINLAKGKYIARMDADDISLEKRLSLQVTFLEKHPAIGLCGTFFYSWKGDNKVLKILAADPEEIKAELLFRSPIAHPTVMFRKELVEAFSFRYSTDVPSAEDYDLWTRMVKVVSLENIPEPLLLYREHNMQVTKTKTEEKESSRHKVMFAYFSWFGISPSAAEKEIQIHISDGKSKGNIEFLKAAEQWLKKISDAGRTSGKVNSKMLGIVLQRYWLKVCENSGLGWKAKKIYASSSLSKGDSLSFRSWLKLHYKIVTRYKQY